MGMSIYCREITLLCFYNYVFAIIMLPTDVTKVAELFAQTLGRVEICRTDVEVGTCRFCVYAGGFGKKTRTKYEFLQMNMLFTQHNF